MSKVSNIQEVAEQEMDDQAYLNAQLDRKTVYIFMIQCGTMKDIPWFPSTKWHQCLTYGVFSVDQLEFH